MTFLSETWYEVPYYGMTVYQRETRDSEVLDQYGRPFVIERPFNIGFDLKKKEDIK